MLHTINKKNAALSFLIAACIALPALSHALPDMDLGRFHPLIGVDIQHRNMEFKTDFGDNLWKETYPQANLYLGLRYGSYFGFVVGHENSKTRSQTVNLSPGETFLGVPLTDGLTLHASGDIKGTYAQLMGYYPVPFLKSTELFLGLGIIHNKMDLDDEIIAINDVAQNPPLLFTTPASDTHAKIEVGIQKIICNHFGLRAVAGWENTSEFKNIRALQALTDPRHLDLKDTWTVGAGFFWIL
jgi:hypothetical protein